MRPEVSSKAYSNVLHYILCYILFYGAYSENKSIYLMLF